MTVRLTIRAGGDVRVWNTSEWNALVALGTISAEPETMPEFFAALRRFQPEHRWDERGKPAAIEDAFASGDSCFIDFDSRSAFAVKTFELCDRHGGFQANEDEVPEGFPVVWIDVPDDWLFEPAPDDWLSTIARRARERRETTRIETRPILFGSAMLEFLADRLLAANVTDDDERAGKQIRSIHAEWLMMPRDDLHGRTPREVLLCRQKHIGLDIQHRSDQWSRQQCAPVGLDERSAAYRFGGYGIAEITIYFDLMRSLLGYGWDWVLEGVSREELLERLARHREEFLAEPPDVMGPRMSRREHIEFERRRMPVASDGSHRFDDCPICEAEENGLFGPGPTFCVWDGYHLEMDDEFAFSTTESREEWEKDQEDSRRHMEEWRRKEEERKASGEEPEAVWGASFVDWDSITAGDSPISAKLAIGFPLAEIISGLQLSGARSQIDAVNAAYAEFRRAADPIAEQSTAKELKARLEEVAGVYPDLTPQCADLQSRLDEVLRSGVSE